MKTGIVALCDAVYKDEQSNKAILAGLYSGGIVLDQMPVEFRFSLYIEVFLPDSRDHEIDLQFFEGGKHRGGAMIQASAVDPSDPVTLIVPQVGLLIAKPTTFELRASLDGGKPSRLLRKAIIGREAVSSA